MEGVTDGWIESRVAEDDGRTVGGGSVLLDGDSVVTRVVGLLDGCGNATKSSSTPIRSSSKNLLGGVGTIIGAAMGASVGAPMDGVVDGIILIATSEVA